MKVYLKNYRQSPRKVRLVADLIRGKSVTDAITVLNATPKRATGQFEKTLKSAVANAKQQGVSEINTLFIKEVRVDKGITLHRFMPRAQGRATRIDKHSSNITLTLDTVVPKEDKTTASKKKTSVKKTVKKETKVKATK